MSKIVDIARSYIGQREIQPNAGFEDKKFEKKMKAVGWVKTHAWCAYFGELVWKEAGQNIVPCSASALKTYLNYEAAGIKGSTVPKPGALVVWRNMKNGVPQWTGHLGVVTEVTQTGFKSVEGNTNAVGGREGHVVAEKNREYKWKVTNGLQLVGFINPSEEE